MVVVHGDYGRNLTSEASSRMDPMFMEASLFLASDPLEVPRSGPSSQVDPIEALSGSISVCTWVDPLVGTCSHSDKGNTVLPSHVNGPSSAKGMSYADLFKAPPIQVETIPMVPSKKRGYVSIRVDPKAYQSRLDVFISNDLALSEDVAVPHSLLSNAFVVSSNLIASAIFSNSVSLRVLREQQSESVNAIPIVPKSLAVVPVLNDSSVNIEFDLSLNFSAGQVSSFSRSEKPLESSTTSGLISNVCSTIPIQAIPVIDLLVQTVSTTVGLSLQRPPIPYVDHRVRKDCYVSSQIPSLVASSIKSSRLSVSDSLVKLCLIANYSWASQVEVEGLDASSIS
ncbi:hypothetical protein QYF36_012202 [Acer negundo]|nr:hypothetical protein QYF36_012202 [Acer negundo]